MKNGEFTRAPRATAHSSLTASRLAHLLRVGAIDDLDADLVRARFDAHPAEEWSTLLDWCEAAVRDAATACETAPARADRGTEGREVSSEPEKRVSGPISTTSRP